MSDETAWLIMAFLVAGALVLGFGEAHAGALVLGVKNKLLLFPVGER